MVLKPGNDLLSHGETPHYHRRCIVSLLSSGWGQVVPMLYGRQANWLARSWVFCARCTARLQTNRVVNQTAFGSFSSSCRLSCYFCDSPQTSSVFSYALAYSNILDYMVKPHGQLVLVSSTPYSAYTPSLSTS